MIPRLKEHKFLFMIAAGMGFLFIYPYVSNLFLEEQPLAKEEWILEENFRDANEFEESEGDVDEMQTMMADIKGAVVNPGVYVVKESERVIDLIEKAGGLTEEANTDAVNFAMKISDEMVVVIPKIGEEQLGMNDELGTSLGRQLDSKVNLNTASASELETLSGIGPSKSAAIIEHRETKGPFKSIDDLKLISGIGEKTFEKLQDKISVK